MKYIKGDFYIYNDKKSVNPEVLKTLFSTSYWASERTIEVIEKSIEHSECFSLYHKNCQIGFARVVTDYSTFGYIADVIIDTHYRGLGLGQWLVEIVVSDIRWKDKFILLATDDAHSLYQKYGFKQSDKLMGMG